MSSLANRLNALTQLFLVAHEHCPAVLLNITPFGGLLLTSTILDEELSESETAPVASQIQHPESEDRKYLQLTVMTLCFRWWLLTLHNVYLKVEGQQPKWAPYSILRPDLLYETRTLKMPRQ